MHYYQFNIADYRKDTYPLTPVQHMIYRWLIDEYYLNEKPFPNNMSKLLWRLGLAEDNRNDLELILENFFEAASDEDFIPKNPSDYPELADIGDYPNLCQYWVHPRIEADIAAYKLLQEKKSKAGKASGKSRSKKESNTRSSSVQQSDDSVELTINHKPETINHKPVKKKGFSKPTITELVDAFAGKVTDSGHQAGLFLCHYESNGWKVGKNSMKSWQHAVTNWITRSKQNATGQQFGQKAVSKSERRDEAARRYLEENNDDGLAWPTGNEVSP